MKMIELNGRHSKGNFMIVDEADAHLFTGSWYLTATGYACQEQNGRQTLAHRLIMDFPDSGIDHANRNKLDNRRQNLRLATASQNQANKPSTNKTSYKGVRQKKNRYEAYIKGRYLGLYKTIKEAAAAYNAAAIKEWGDYALLNEVS